MHGKKYIIKKILFYKIKTKNLEILFKYYLILYLVVRL